MKKPFVMNNWCKKLLLVSCLLNGSVHALSVGKTTNKGVISIRTRNDVAQQIFEVISAYCNISREDFMKDPLWKRTKRYIYHATTSSSDTLSVDQVESVLRILDMFNDEIATSILQSIPRILRKDPQNHLKPTISFLNDIYSELFEEAIRRNPNLLLTSGLGYNAKRSSKHSNDDPDQMILEDYLIHQQLLSSAQIEKLKSSHPLLFQLSITKVQSNVEYLLNTLGGSRSIVSRLIRANPNILSLSTSNLESKISFFESYGFCSYEELVQLFKKSPLLLGLSLEKNLKPTTDMIRNVVDRYESKSKCTTNLLYKTLSGHPNLLALSPQNLDEKTKYFDSLSGSGNDTPSLAARILVTVPSVYSLSLPHNIQPKIDYFEMLWNVSGDPSTSSNVSKYLYEYPNVLSLSLEGNIQPTINFYNRTGYISLDHSEQNKTKNMLPPRYIATSLSRLLARWNFYLAQESQQRNNLEAVASNKPPLHILATATDRNFCCKMGYDFSVYLKYKDEIEPRLKFNYQFETWLKTGLPIK
jgi:hypothetical protein